MVLKKFRGWSRGVVQRGGGTPLPQNRARKILYVAHASRVPPLEEGHPPVEEGHDNSMYGLIFFQCVGNTEL